MRILVCQPGIKWSDLKYFLLNPLSSQLNDHFLGKIRTMFYIPKSIILMPQVLRIIWSNPISRRFTLSFDHFFARLWLPFLPIIWNFLSDVSIAPNFHPIIIGCFLVVGCSRRSTIENLLFKNSNTIHIHIFKEVLGVGITTNPMLIVF